MARWCNPSPQFSADSLWRCAQMTLSCTYVIPDSYLNGKHNMCVEEESVSVLRRYLRRIRMIIIVESGETTRVENMRCISSDILSGSRLDREFYECHVHSNVSSTKLKINWC